MDAEEAELFARVHDAPDDDEPRLVYADWLLERGRLQGELIHLACEAARRPLQGRKKRRLTALLAHERDWLGKVAAATDRFSRVYDRGFLAGCMLQERTPGSLDASLGDPAWAFVRAIGNAAHTTEEQLVRVLDQPLLRWLDTLRGLTFHRASFLLEGKPRPQIVRLQLHAIEARPELRGAFDREDALPNVRHLELGSGSMLGGYEWIFGTRLGRRLETFRVVCDLADLAAWHGRIVDLPLPLRRLDVVPWGTTHATLRFDRTPEGRWDVLDIRDLRDLNASLTVVARGLATIQAGVLSRVRLTWPARLEAHELERLRSALPPGATLEHAEPARLR